ncbi:phage late control D family protein [Paenibacillus azoreducens]|uniref:phage late control D family protein n=1 Tax=Paenibacillus azoreducens TaxID=116718 RepID=UPI0039F50DBF
MKDQGRRVYLEVDYKDYNASALMGDYLTNFSYTDNYSGKFDDLQITLEDRKQLWQGSWKPHAGDEIRVKIHTKNWRWEGDNLTLPCGKFDVDEVTFTGPPDVVEIRATSVPLDSSGRREKKTKSWEKATLKRIAQDIAKNAKLTLAFNFSQNPKYDRIDQTEQSDIEFLVDLCAKEGASIKVSNRKLVIFDEVEFEKKKPAIYIVRGKSNVMSYSFSWNAMGAAYRACQVSYQSPKKKKNISYTYSPPGAPKKGPVLKINERVESQAEAIRVAKNRLREKNKEFGKGTITIAGDPRLAAGITIYVQGWRSFDGKYIIECAKHSINNGYTTEIDIRKVLGY